MVSTSALAYFIGNKCSRIIIDSENALLLQATEDTETFSYKHNLTIKKGEYLAIDKKIIGTCESTYACRSTKGDYNKCFDAYRRYAGILEYIPPTESKRLEVNNITQNEVAKAMFFYDIIDRILIDNFTAENGTISVEDMKTSVLTTLEEFPKYIELYFSDFEREV